MVVAALTLAVGGAILAYPSVAKADCGIAVDTNIVAYNISDNNSEVYEENYLSVDNWKRDYTNKYNELNELADDIDSLGAYVEEEFEVDWDSFVYIKDVQSKIDELVSIKTAAQERKAEAERIAAERAAAERAAREAQVATYTATNYSNSVPNDGGGSSYSGSSGGKLTAQGGVNYYNNQKETYYNLDMSGVISNAQAQGIEGDYWVRNDGVKMYGDYVIVASQHDKGTVIDTSLGQGIVLDYCPSNSVDIATNW